MEVILYPPLYLLWHLCQRWHYLSPWLQPPALVLVLLPPPPSFNFLPPLSPVLVSLSSFTNYYFYRTHPPGTSLTLPPLLPPTPPLLPVPPISDTLWSLGYLLSIFCCLCWVCLKISEGYLSILNEACVIFVISNSFVSGFSLLLFFNAKSNWWPITLSSPIIFLLVLFDSSKNPSQWRR